MDTLGYIILFTFLGSVVSLIGGIILLAKEKLALKISRFLAAFAAGALLATAFFDLLPEALEHSEELGAEVNIFLWALIGILSFFLVERFIHWFHHHSHEHDELISKPTVSLIIFGDSIHNFIDGIAIAAAFLVDIQLGIITSLAVAAHEIPQEIGDFGVLIHRGVKRAKVLLVNLFSAVAALVGALFTFYLGASVEGLLPMVLALTAGFFIYIAASDLMPEMHDEKRSSYAFWETASLFIGVGVVYLAIQLLEGYIAH